MAPLSGQWQPRFNSARFPKTIEYIEEIPLRARLTSPGYGDMIASVFYRFAEHHSRRHGAQQPPTFHR